MASQYIDLIRQSGVLSSFLSENDTYHVFKRLRLFTYLGIGRCPSPLGEVLCTHRERQREIISCILDAEEKGFMMP